jgi:hypothetical protein
MTNNGVCDSSKGRSKIVVDYRYEGFAMSGKTTPLKQQAHALIDNLPESATWDDLAYEAELRASIERGVADTQAGRVVAVEELMKDFGIEE